MKTVAIPALMLSTSSASRDGVKSRAPAKCTFSDGSTITVTYSREQRGCRFSTLESVLSVAGESSPAGDYMAYLNLLSRDQWSLNMLKPGRRFVRPFLAHVGHGIHTVADHSGFHSTRLGELRDVP